MEIAMKKTLMKYMDWPNIEGLVYAENDNPHQVLGARIMNGRVLITCFFPDALSVDVVLESTDKKEMMLLMDEAGYFAILLDRKKVPKYHYEVAYEKGSVVCMEEAYNFDPVISPKDIARFENGIHYDIYDKLGAHPMTIKSTAGVLFAVWAPNAVAVSVVGDFNLWDGRKNPMRRLDDSGIFELFIPGMVPDTIYKYEIHKKGGTVCLKADPYANFAELRPHTASIVWNLDNYQWRDDQWLVDRKKANLDQESMLIYELHLGSFCKPEEGSGRDFYSYRELAPKIADYCKNIGYTHVELMPVMEHPLDASWGYQVTGYYAPTSRYGTPDDFMYFIDYLHQNNIGVILDWVPAHFPKDEHGLACFDGTCLYEHLDPRQGEHPDWGTLIYNYGRPQVSNFLIANALFWLERYHMDGLRFDAVASMLYLDYGKKDGEWVANIYGGNENLEAVEFIKHVNSMIHKRNDGTVTIAEESTAWPMVTGSLEEGGLGFDYKWNMGWMNDFLEYMRTDALFRKGRHGMLTFSMVYNYSEKFVLVLSHDEVVHGKCSMLEKMPGSKEDKMASLRVAYGFMMTHPGKKLLFMGQEFGQEREWSEERSLDWNLILEGSAHQKLQMYMKSLYALYRKHPALFRDDYNPDGFRWVSMLDADHSVIAFLRKTNKETLLVVCNFTPVPYEKFRLGVPFDGKYKEVFNSDAEEFGGKGFVNSRVKASRKNKMDGMENSIEFKLPGLGISVFNCIVKE